MSKRLRALGTQAGTVLIVRTRPLKATQAGKLLFKHAIQMRLLQADLAHYFQDLAPGRRSGAGEDMRIPIAVNADSIATWAPSALDQLAQGGLSLMIIADDQDLTHDWLREGKVLGCVTTLKHALRRCKVVPLGAMHYLVVASAHYANAHCPEGLTQHNLCKIPFVAFNRKDDLQAEFVSKACGLKRVILTQRYVPSFEGQVRAVLAGWGVSVVPEMLVADMLDSGQLINLSPSFRCLSRFTGTAGSWTPPCWTRSHTRCSRPQNLF